MLMYSILRRITGPSPGKTYAEGRFLSSCLSAALILVCLYTVSPAAGLEAAEARPLEARLGASIKALAGFGSRLTGSPGFGASFDWIAHELEACGVTEVYRHRFPVVMPEDRGFFLLAESVSRTDSLRLYGVWPNLVRTPTLPADGIRGRLLLWDGRMASLANHQVEGRIVVVPYGDRRWLDLFQMGARAVVFLEPTETHRADASRLFLDVPIDLPRLYAAGTDADALVRMASSQIEVRIGGRMDLAETTGWNIIGVIPGREESRSSVAVVAHFDSSSPVPAVSPGAEQACSAAALLELAPVLIREPPARTTLLIFTSGHYQNLTGMRHLVRDLKRLGENAGGRKQDSCLDSPTFIPPFIEPLPAAFLTLDLSSHSQVLRAASPRAPYRKRSLPPAFANALFEQIVAFERAYRDGQPVVANGFRLDQNRSGLSGLPLTIPTEGAVASLAGFPSAVLVTTNDSRGRADSPVDLPRHVQMGSLSAQVELLLTVIPNLLRDPDLNLGETDRDAFGDLAGRVVRYGRTSYIADKPVKGALVRLRLRGRTNAGVRPDFWAASDDSGRFCIPGVESGLLYTQPTVIEAYQTDAITGRIIGATDLGVRGARGLPGRTFRILMDGPIENVDVTVAPVEALGILDTFDPRSLTIPDGIEVFEAGTGVEPSSFGACLPVTRREADLFDYPSAITSRVVPAAAVFAPGGSRVQALFTMGGSGWDRRSLFLGGGPPQGDGLAIGGTDGGTAGGAAFSDRGAHAAARDMTALNGFRIDQLVSHGIRHSRLEEFHRRSVALLDSASQAMAQHHPRNSLSNSRLALSHAFATYAEVDRSTTGVIGGALAFLFLLIPYALVMERLLIASRSVSGKVIGFLGFFLCTATVFGWSHPAFSLSVTPVMVLLGFVILTLSGVVSFLGAQRLNRELLLLGTDEGARSSQGLAVVAAFQTSLALMRRRRFRTGLTAATLVLVTFSLVSFTSIRSTARTHFRSLEGSAAYDGALVRRPGWEPLPVTALEMFQDRFGSKAVSGRAWLTAKGSGGTVRIQRHGPTAGGTGPWAVARGIVGMTSVDGDFLGAAVLTGRWISEAEENVCLISSSMAEALRISHPGVARVSISGEAFRVIGFFDAGALDQAVDLNGESVTPLEPDLDQPTGIDVEEGEFRFVHLPAADCVVVPLSDVMRWEGASLSTIGLRIAGKSNLRELSHSLDLDLYCGMDGNRFLLSTVGLASISGSTNVIVPILLAALIVLNTMLGAVYEREREIGILNAVGLSPRQVLMLFILESMIFAVLGAVTGYLLGLVSGGVLAERGWIAGLQLNYTTSEPLLAMGAVVAIAVASSLYPAWLASRVCTPGLERRWRLPDAEDDVLRLTLPFSLKQEDAEEVMRDLGQYLAAQDRTVGATFQASEVTQKVDSLSARIRLAPFDQALLQMFDMVTVPLPDGYIELAVACTRLEGDLALWQRSNHYLIDALRRRFLIWRSRRRIPILDAVE